MSENNNHRGIVISIRVRDEEYAEIERIAKILFDLGRLKSANPAALTKASLLMECNKFLILEKQTQQANQSLQQYATNQQAQPAQQQGQQPA